MHKHFLLHAALFLFAVGLISLLVWLTLPEPRDICDQSMQDVSAAVLADQAGDQDALVNRAIILKGNCGGESEEAGN